MSQDRLSTESWIPRTKLVIPRPGRAVVLEPALLDTLRATTASTPLTLIAAQAGSGKTTLAATLVATMPPGSVAWISLDDGDNDLAILLPLLAMALDPLLPGGCAALHDLLRADLPGADDPRRGAGVLVNDVLAADPGPILLVLDDLHVVTDPDARTALGYLLDHAPPALRLLATARTDPSLGLSRRRARGELAEVRTEQLRCTADRAAALLNGHLDLRLTPEQVDHAVSASGGWITGVRLLGESLARGAGGSTTVTGSADLHDYLAEEVLDALPEYLRHFLLDTSILDDLTPAACTAVAMRDDAAALLATLHRTHQFLVTIDERFPGGYRYQTMFGTFLRRMLELEEPARAAKLHRRAADAVTEPARRVEHLLAAGAHDEAATEIERLGRVALHHSVATRGLAAWIARLDPPYRNRPWLAALAGLDAVGRGDLRRGAALLDTALEQFEAAGDVPGEWVAARHLHLATDDHRRFAPVLARLERSPDFPLLPAAAQVDHHIDRAYGALHTGVWDEATRRLATAIELTTTNRDLDAVDVLAQHISPLLAACDGGLDLIEPYTTWVRRHVPDPPPLVQVGIDHQTAITAFLRGRLDDAVAAAQRAAELVRRLGGMPFLRATTDWVLAAAPFVRGDPAGALAVLDAATGPASDLERSLRVAHLALRARILRHQRRGPELAELVQELAVVAPGWVFADRLELVGFSVRGQVAWAARDLDGAARILRSGLAAEEHVRMVTGVGNLRLDLALVLADAGLATEAQRELATVLAMVARRGWIGILVEAGPEVVPLLEVAARSGVHARTATAALDVLRETRRSVAVEVPGTGEVLSVREVEVLRLLAGGASNADLAVQLVVSVNTVKTHVSRIMTKLGARSRTEAVARARALHLL